MSVGSRRRVRDLFPEILTVGTLVALAIVVAAKAASRPAWWPEDTLTAWLRSRTPYGTSESEVRAFLQRRGWHSIWAPGQDSLNRAHHIKFSDGSQTLEVVLGAYRSPLFLFLFRTTTEVFYGFDEDGRLVDIRVRKDTDAL